VNNPYLLIGLRKTPEILRRLSSVLPASAFDERRDPERFTLREALCHMADWEPIFCERLKGTLEIEGYMITPYDEGAMAIERNYAAQDVDATLERFKEGRSATIQLLRKLADEDWDKLAGHPERGPMSIADQASLILGHDL
jgi:uncharacterized damage-inducible protein DinB